MGYGWISVTIEKLIHHYFRVDFDIVWQVAKEELPQIKTQIEEII